MSGINNFFTGGYEPYSSAIDFFLFAILFTSVYMVGAKYAFKDMKNPERVIVILLGLTTAFLLVLAGFSIKLLLPFMNWIVYILLFMFLFWILGKGESKLSKNGFLRFLIALLIVLLLLALLQGFYDFNTFFKFCELQYFNWLLVILVFVLMLFVLRKAIENKFWRFVVALLIALLFLYFFIKICGSIELPDVNGINSGIPTPSAGSGAGLVSGAGNYFTSMFDNFKTIDLGSYWPGTPDWFSGSTPTTSSTPGNLPVVNKPTKAPTPSSGGAAKVVAPCPAGETRCGDGMCRASCGPVPGRITTSPIGDLFEVDPKNAKTQKEYEDTVKSVSEKGKNIVGEDYYTKDEDGKLVLKRKRFLFGLFDYGYPDETLDPNNYYIEGGSLKRSELGSDATIDPSVASKLQKYLDSLGSARVKKISQLIPLEDIKISQAGFGADSPLGLVYLIILLLGLYLFNKFRRGRKSRITIQEEIGEIIKKKKKILERILILNNEKNQIIRAADRKIKYMRDLKEITYLWEKINEVEIAGEEYRRSAHIEIKLIVKLKELMKIERDVLERIEIWKNAISKRNTGVIMYTLPGLKKIICGGEKKDRRGNEIIYIILFCFNAEEREYKMEKELADLLKEDDIKKLIEDKLRKIGADEYSLDSYNEKENHALGVLRSRVEEQIDLMDRLMQQVPNIRLSKKTEPEQTSAATTGKNRFGTNILKNREKRRALDEIFAGLDRISKDKEK